MMVPVCFTEFPSPTPQLRMELALMFQTLISEHFTADHNLTLTFTYEMAPRYMIVSIGNVSA